MPVTSSAMVRRWVIALPIALLVLAAPARAQTILPLPTTEPPPTTTTEPPVTTTEHTTTTGVRSTTTVTRRSGGVGGRATTSTTGVFGSTTSLPVPASAKGDGLSTDTLVRLIIGALLLIAIIVAGATWWFWRFTDPRARAAQ